MVVFRILWNNYLFFKTLRSSYFSCFLKTQLGKIDDHPALLKTNSQNTSSHVQDQEEDLKCGFLINSISTKWTKHSMLTNLEIKHILKIFAEEKGNTSEKGDGKANYYFWKVKTKFAENQIMHYWNFITLRGSHAKFKLFRLHRKTISMN